jgi:DNA processing protein
VSDAGLLWFRLYQTPGLGPKRLHRVYQELRGRPLTEDELLRFDTEEWRRELRHRGIPPAAAVAAAYKRLRARGVEVVHLGHPAYPSPALARLGDRAPPLLFCRGPLDLLSKRGVAVVGARHAGARALEVAERLGQELARRGWNVLSGYAAGVDDRAHLGALRAGGTTTLVLSTGILRFTPRASSRAMFERGVPRLLAISQFKPEDSWRPGLAMARNGLVCALATAVVVVASGVHTLQGKSGTFDAGETALRLGVPLYVVRPEALGSDPPPGNEKLLTQGGLPLDPADLDAFFGALAERTPTWARRNEGEQARLLE